MGKETGVNFYRSGIRMCVWGPNVQMGCKVRKYVGHRSIITEEEAMHIFCFLHVCRRATAGGGTCRYQVMYPFSFLKLQSGITFPLTVLRGM